MKRLHLTMKGRLAMLAGLALVGICVLAALAFGSYQINQRALTRLYDQDIEALVRLQRIENGLLEVRFRVAGVLLEQLPVPGSLNHLREVRKGSADEWSAFASRGEQIYRDGEAASAFKQLRQGWGGVEATLAKLENGYAANDKTMLAAMLEDDWPAMHKAAIKPLQALIPVTQQSAESRYRAAVERSRTLLVVGLGTAAACLVLLGVVAWLTARSMLRPLHEVAVSMQRIAEGDLATAVPAVRADEVGVMIAALADMRNRLRTLVADLRRSSDSIATASAQIAAGSQDLSHRTELAASNLQQTAGSMEQLTGTVRQSADSAQHANTLASTAAAVAQRGGNVVAQVVATMDEIQASSRQIADITGTIDSIAFQTNILALNAAVEAARAGEQGRGFAVVASEVRSLAQRSAAAAKQIKELIAASVDRVGSGSRLVADAGSTMSEIVVSVKRVSGIVGEISGAAGEQSQGIGQINGAVSQLDEMTQQNAALVEQSAAAAESLKGQARHLAEAIGTFKL